MEITSRVADMVQDWGEAFLPQKYQFPWFIYPYHRMRRRGVKFSKQYDETKVPVITPPRKTDRNSASSKPMASVSSSSSALSGLSPKELYRVAVNVSEMFEDMLYEVQKSSAGIGSHGVIVELASQAGELVQRLESIIQRAVANDDPALANYLSVNDTLNAAIKKFEALPVNNQSSERRSSVSSAKGGRSSNLLDFDDNQQDNDARASGSRNNQEEDDDDPFADFVRARVQGPTTTSAAPTKAPQANKDEDDPFADFVQYRADSTKEQDDLLLTETKPATPVAKNLIDLWDGKPASSLVFEGSAGLTSLSVCRRASSASAAADNTEACAASGSLESAGSLQLRPDTCTSSTIHGVPCSSAAAAAGFGGR